MKQQSSAYLFSSEYFRMISSSKLSLSVPCVRKKAPKSGMRFQAPERHAILPPVSPLLSRIPSPCQGCLALPSGTVATTNSPPPSLPPHDTARS